MRTQSAFRIAYAFESSCLFLSILLGVDRISEQALRAKHVSKLNALDMVGDSSDANAAGRRTSIARRSGGAVVQLQPLLQAPESRMASIKRWMSQKFGRTLALQLIFRSGLALVLLCFVVQLVAVVTAAAVQAMCDTRPVHHGNM